MRPKGSIFRKNVMAWDLLKSFLTAFGLTAVFHPPLQQTSYETGLDYVIASVYELLGPYDFKFLLLFVLSAIFYVKVIRGYSFCPELKGRAVEEL